MTLPGRRLVDQESLVAFALPFVVYVLTIAPTVYPLDSAELTTAAATGGILRATGYPLYLLLGRAWSRLPIGDVGLRMNLLSAVCGALTIALAYRLLRRLGIGPWPAAGALGLLAASRYFWAMSLVAEVYTLHTALLAVVLLALLHYAECPSTGRLALATFAVGLACTHHVSAVLLAPGCVWLVLRSGGLSALRPPSLAAAGGGLVAGLALYAYLPLLYLSSPAFNYAGHYDASGSFVPIDLTTPGGLWWLVSGRVFAGQMLAYPPRELVAELGHFAAELWRTFLAVGVGPGLAGAFLLARRRPALGGALLLMFALTVGFYVDYRVVDKDTMFLGAYLIFAVWVAIGYQWLEEYLGARRGALWGLRVVSCGAVVVAALWNGPLVDLSGDRSGRERGEAVLSELAPQALLVGWWDTVPLVEYLQLVEGRRPDVTAVNRFLISEPDLSRLLAEQAGRRPVYLDRPPDEALGQLSATQVGLLYRVTAPGH